MFSFEESTGFSQSYLAESVSIIQKIDSGKIEEIVQALFELKKRRGRLFLVGMGGSASNTQHAANDFRKLAGIESYSCSDNVAELTARANDEGLETIFEGYLKSSNFSELDTLFVLSVGGGSWDENVSVSICRAIDYAHGFRSDIIGVVGRDGGYVAQKSDKVLIIPTENISHVTPHSETCQALIWHLLVSHPRLKQAPTKW